MRFPLPSVASDQAVHHSPHLNSSPRNRPVQSDSTPKEPATPFSLLLDSANDAAPPPPTRDQTDTATARSSQRSSADNHRDDPPSDASSPDKAHDGAAQQTSSPQPNPSDATATAVLGDDGQPGEKKPSEAKDAKDGVAASTPQMQPTAAMMQQFLADATAAAQDAPDAAQLAALKAAEKSGGRAPDATALKGQQAQSSDDDGQPATAATTPGEGVADNANLAEAQAKHAAIEAVGEATHGHAAKPGHAVDTDQKPGDVAKLADFDAHLAQATTDTKVAPDGSAPALGAAQPAERAAAAATASAPAPGPAATGAVPLAGVAVEIAARAHAGSNRFEIRLDPPELGRIDVRLDVDRDGHVTSRLVVDRPETLDALRRDAPDLQRALQQAGLKTSDNGLQFSLRDQSFAGGHQAFQQQQTTTSTFISDSDLGPVDGLQAAYGRVLRAGGLDISV